MTGLFLAISCVSAKGVVVEVVLVSVAVAVEGADTSPHRHENKPNEHSGGVSRGRVSDQGDYPGSAKYDE